MIMDSMKKFDAAFDYVMINEGGLEENEADPGGITKYGISLRFLRSLGKEKLKEYNIYIGDIVTPEDINDLTFEQSKAVYFGEFWQKAPFEKLNWQEVVNYIFDMAVNMGISPAIKCAQRAVWAVCKNKNVLQEDGILNDTTVGMINHCEFFIIASMRSERAGVYRLIVEKNPKEKIFLSDWLKRSYNK